MHGVMADDVQTKRLSLDEANQEVEHVSLSEVKVRAKHVSLFTSSCLLGLVSSLCYRGFC